jgi:hypothetical protein
VYVAEAQWEEKLSGRMGSRRYEKKMETFSYRTVDGLVTFVADKPCGGTKAPKVAMEMTPDEARSVLIERFSVPLHHGHEFSKGWRFLSKETGGSGVIISLDGLTDEQVERFEVMARAMVKAHGLPPGVVPPTVWRALTKLRNKMLKAGS